MSEEELDTSMHSLRVYKVVFFLVGEKENGCIALNGLA